LQCRKQRRPRPARCRSTRCGPTRRKGSGEDPVPIRAPRKEREPQDHPEAVVDDKPLDSILSVKCVIRAPNPASDQQQSSRALDRFRSTALEASLGIASPPTRSGQRAKSSFTSSDCRLPCKQSSGDRELLWIGRGRSKTCRGFYCEESADFFPHVLEVLLRARPLVDQLLPEELSSSFNVCCNDKSGESKSGDRGDEIHFAKVPGQPPTEDALARAMGTCPKLQRTEEK
jgi:hypothetical protein